MMSTVVSYFRRAVCFTVLMLVFLPTVSGFVAMRVGTAGRPLLWPAERFPISLRMNDLTAAGAPNLASGSNVTAAMNAAMQAWQSIPTASIRFAAVQDTPIASTFEDGVNVVTMLDTPVNRSLLGGSDGAVAATRIVYDASTGVISEADIVLNPHDSFSTNMAPGTYDLQSILTHELGHFLGCDHAVAQNDTMFSLTWREEFLQRNLSADSIAFATSAYPDKGRITTPARITGRVRQASKGVFGASVAAIDLDRNLLYTALTEPDGTYSIPGPIGGRYAVYVEPLNGPTLPEDFLIHGNNAFYKNLNTSFRTIIREVQVPSPTEKVSIKQLQSQVDFDLPAPPATLNIDRMGAGDPVTQQGFLDVGPVAVSPGDNLLLCLGGNGVPRVDNVEDIRMLGNGITVNAGRGIKVLRNAAGAEVGISVLIHVSPDAVPGPRTVAVRVDGEDAVSTGGVVVTARRPPVLTLYMPYLATDRHEYTGIGIANLAPVPATVRVTARDDDGVLLYDQDSLVPRDVSVPARSQLAKTVGEILNLPPFASQTGSITLESDTEGVQGFFLSGDIASSKLDGAEAFTRGYRELYFPDILQDAVTETEIHLMNISDTPVTAVLELVDAGGRPITSALNRVIPARGRIAGPVASLFGFGADLSSAHVRATAARDCLVGFGLTRQTGTVLGLNAQPVDKAASVLYSPQLAVGDFGVHFSTRLNVVNIGQLDATVSIRLYSDTGEPLPGVNTLAPLTIARGGQMSIDVGSAFGLAGKGPVQGSIAVVAGGEGKLIGNVVFGNGNPASDRLDFGAALPLSGTGDSKFVFSQVAQGQGFYTGVAFLAPSGAELVIEVYRQDGTLVRSVAKLLAPGERLSSILENLIPETAGQVGGYVKVSSLNAVIAFELFGATDGQFLSAVPPQRLGP